MRCMSAIRLTKLTHHQAELRAQSSTEYTFRLLLKCLYLYSQGVDRWIFVDGPLSTIPLAMAVRTLFL